VYIVEATLAIYFLGFAVGVSLWGAVSDLCGRRAAMLTGLIIYGIGTLACGNVGSAEALLGWRFLQAFGASVGSVVTQTILRDAYIGAERSKLFSVMSGALAFSPALGPVLGGFISEFWGWRANFWVLVVFAVVLFIWSFRSLPETRPAHIVRLSLAQVGDLAMTMLKSRVLWGHVILIASTNGILFGFYQEAPFVFIDQLGLRPSLYGGLGVLIAAATIVAARFSYCQNGSHLPETIIRLGTGCVLLGSVFFTVVVYLGLFKLDIIGIVLALPALFAIFFGMGLIIPNSLSIALKPYQMAAGTAGSIFGFLYYCIIAGDTWLMSVLHDGTALPLPLYITALGIVICAGYWMIKQPKMSAYTAETSA
jgi:Bcr/CflA subfamily drug resistance transporter